MPVAVAFTKGVIRRIKNNECKGVDALYTTKSRVSCAFLLKVFLFIIMQTYTSCNATVPGVFDGLPYWNTFKLTFDKYFTCCYIFQLRECALSNTTA